MMKPNREIFCVFLASVLMFSSFYSSSSLMMTGRIPGNGLPKAYAQTSALGALQQQQVQQRLQIQQKQQQQPLSSLYTINPNPLQQQQQQLQNRGLQPLSPGSAISQYYQNILPLQQQQQQQQTVPGSSPSSPSSSSVIKDTTPPDTAIVSVVDGNNAPVQNGSITQSNKIAFAIQGVDNVAVAGFQCSLDNAQASACTSPVILNNLQPGTHILQVRALDDVGNADASPVSFRWNVLTYSTTPLINNNAIINNPSNSILGKTQIPSTPSSQQQQQLLPQNAVTQLQRQQQLQPVPSNRVVPLSANTIPKFGNQYYSHNINPYSFRQYHYQNKSLTANLASPLAHNTLPFFNLGQHLTTKTSARQNSSLPRGQAILNNSTNTSAGHINNTSVQPTNNSIGLARPKALTSMVGPQSNNTSRNTTSVSSNSSGTTPNAQSSTNVSSSTQGLTSVTGSQFSGSTDFKVTTYVHCLDPATHDADVCIYTVTSHTVLSGTLIYAGHINGGDIYVPTPGEQMGTCDGQYTSEDLTQGTPPVDVPGSPFHIVIYGNDPTNPNPLPSGSQSLLSGSAIAVDRTQKTMNLVMGIGESGGTLLCGSLGGLGHVVSYNENNGIASASDTGSFTAPNPTDPSLPEGSSGYNYQWSATVVLPPCDPNTQTCPGTGGSGPPSDFSISCINPTAIAPSETGQTNCTVTSINGFDQPVDLSCNPPATGSGVTCGFSPNTVTPPSNSQITARLVISADVNTNAPADYSLNIVGTSGSQSHSTTVSIRVAPYTFNVQPSKTEMNPYSNGNVPPSPSSIMQPIAISATKPDGTTPAAGIQVQVIACTQKGAAPTLGAADADGHSSSNHDKGTTGFCSQFMPNDPTSTRPHSSLCTPPAFKTFPVCNNPITITTDGSGKATLNYIPPHSTTTSSSGNPFYISGIDKIFAAKADNLKGSKQQNDAQIKTAVPGLGAMYDSVTASCPAAGNTYGGTTQDFEPFPGIIIHYQLDKFQSQGSHGCLFYGTPQTKDAIIWIANTFTAAQIECFKQPGHECHTITINGQPRTILNDHNAPEPVKVAAQTLPVKITAMSLPWGGLNDIGAPQGKEWEPPHKSHNDGKEVDFGFSDYKINANAYNRNMIVLLRFISTQAPYFDSFVKEEGGDIASTLLQPGPHIHINFNQ